ncbi:MAG: DUF3047 domain-containing protein [Gemmatimonadales bacterium]|jgi:hypothetical protein
MNRYSHLPALILAASLLGWHSADAAAQDRMVTIRADYSEDWAQHWEDVRLASRVNRFTVVDEAGTSVLKAFSENSASALWHEIGIAPGDGDRVSWRWKVERPLVNKAREREKRGDDYAARLFVIFNAEPFSRQARAICYVWSSTEPVGAAYPNPYFSNVGTVVVQHGNERIGQWIREEREFVQDYREAFGEDPETVTAVAVMVDTDNTGGSALSWFDSIEIKTRVTDSAPGQAR